MSESVGKTFRGLQEAYASIYANKSENLTEDTIVSEVQEEQEFEINEEELYESMIGYLVHFGYASDAKKAAAILPYMSEQWCKSFALDYVLLENFEYCVEHLIQEGCNFSSYTWDELYESYVDGYSSQYLVEEPISLTATSPIWGPALLGGAAALYGLNKDKIDRAATGAVQRATDFVMQMAKGKRRLSRERRQQAAKDRLQQQQAAQPQQPQQPQQTAQTSGTGSTSQGSSGTPQGPQGPKPDWRQKGSELLTKAREFFKPKPSQPLPKPPSLSGAKDFVKGMGDVANWTGQHIVGRTLGGKLARTAGATIDYAANRPAQELQGQQPTPTIGGQTLANTIGAGSNIVTQAGRFINQLTGIKGVENIGRLGKRTGQELSDWDKRGTAQDPKKGQLDAEAAKKERERIQKLFPNTKPGGS